MPSHKSGFTLIELLIVVAIIGILAGIAVPNFLEAQTRAKISRAMSDMRSAATGLETYYVDNNHYPCTVAFGGSQRVLFSAIFDNGVGLRVGHITTPVAYVTSNFTDPFDKFFSSSFGHEPYGYDKAGFGIESSGFYPNGPFSIKVPPPGFVVQLPHDYEQNGINSNEKIDRETREEMETPRRWALWSSGPSGDAYRLSGDNGASRYCIRYRYDPSNGTVSKGFLIRYQGGDSFPAK